MSSFQIHQDQENRAPADLRQIPKGKVQTMAALQQKRPAFGAIDNNKCLKPIEKSKQNFKDTNGRKNFADNGRSNLGAPVVPVAQFEAFKVYEDEENRPTLNQRTQQPLKKCAEVVTTGDGKNFLQPKKCAEVVSTKVEIINVQQKTDLPLKIFEEEEDGKENIPVPQSPKKPVYTSNVESPMSIDLSLDQNTNQSPAVEFKSKLERDVFFEMEEYREDIYSYLRDLEMRNRPKPGYILKQPDVTEKMRAILVDWLVEVTEEYKMHTETLYLAVNYIDRFLSYMSVVRAKLQLVGTAAMYIASKFEEIYPPEIGEFVYITDDTYDKHQVIRMEHLILKVLHFDLSVPTPLTFITAIVTAAKLSDRTMYLAMYLSELSLLEVELYLQFLPSTIAASAIALARHTLGEEVWTESLKKITGYTLAHLQNAINFLYGTFQNAPSNPQHAVQDKYSSSKHMQVSDLVPSTKLITFE